MYTIIRQSIHTDRYYATILQHANNTLMHFKAIIYNPNASTCDNVQITFHHCNCNYSLVKMKSLLMIDYKHILSKML